MTNAFEIWAEHCECPPGHCMHGVENDSECINRLTGEVVTKPCFRCGTITWHQDGVCLRHKRKDP